MEYVKGARQQECIRIYCNCCGLEMNVKGNKQEGYFRCERVIDNVTALEMKGHRFNLCEACYNQLINSFKIPVEEEVMDDWPIYTEEELVALQKAYAQELSK